MIRIKKISKHLVHPINVPKVEPDKIKGYSLIPRLYCTIFICAKKESGKTNAIFKILKECTGKDTTLYIVASTIYNDDNWRVITNFFKKKKINMVISTTLEDAHITEKVQELKNLAEEEMKKQDEEDEQDDYVPTMQQVILDENKEEEVEEKRKPKKVAPEYIFVFDDMSHMLRDKSIGTLIKHHRHFKTKVIFSSQYPNDLAPEARKNINIFLLFAGHSEDKLFELYKNMDLKIPFSLFQTLYENATSKPYSFLYVDTKGEFRKNFNELYQFM